jgi:hypothetical protein
MLGDALPAAHELIQQAARQGRNQILRPAPGATQFPGLELDRLVDFQFGSLTHL